MRTKLSPDGTMIRALRIKRGWTQEQLAEISGISLRTVQRAESASSAAFETMRAIAAAFEKDFDKLLRQEPEKSAINEMQPTTGSEESCPDPLHEQIAPRLPALALRRVWPTQLIVVCALIVGLFIGIALTFHLNRPSPSLPTAYHSVLRALPDAPKVGSQRPLQKKSPRTMSKPKAFQGSVVKAASSDLEFAGDMKASALHAAGIPAIGPAAVSENVSLERIQSSSSPDLPPLKITPLSLVVLDEPFNVTGQSDTSDSSTEEAQASGAVRQAVGLAVKKTGGFVAKARDSIRRAF